jgi:hypothetical protein
MMNEWELGRFSYILMQTLLWDNGIYFLFYNRTERTIYDLCSQFEFILLLLLLLLVTKLGQ